MAKIKVHAGDFLEGDGQFHSGDLVLRTEAHKFFGETIPVTALQTVEIATEESVKKLSGAVGWGAT